MGDGKGLGAMVTRGSVTQWCLLTRNLETVQNLLVEKSQRKVDGTATPEGGGPAEGEQHEDETPKHEIGLMAIPRL